MGPLPPTNLVVRVYNQSPTAGALHWQAQSAGGSGAQAPAGDVGVPPCQEADQVLAAGGWRLTITGGGGTLTDDVEAPQVGQARLAYVIRAGGDVERLYLLAGSDPEPSAPPLC